MFKAKSGRNQDAGARPGAARVLPMRLVARVPLLRRLAPQPVAVKPPALLSPRRLVRLLSGKKATPPPAPSSRLRLSIVGPMIRGVRDPIERTAAVVRAAREVRKPQTRWERLRQAARVAIDDPVDGTRWERLMGLGVGLVAGGKHRKAPKAKTKRLPQLRVSRLKIEAPARRPSLGLRDGLQRLQTLLNENAGPGQRRDRRGIKPPKAR
ncbi:hypothetical protein DFR24_3715 [Panacagrimonas perspica]|uniref:Uncharacterized protein n=1 Tax=Panacagrimonas perspica TaxID=381431 RepID=A0A4V3F609_9GAMM|nr:hypothetical protein [Panacagrimonas perspica]TDU26686.1 hypothetical protein DFR24_3715 [Panacagrimonas perspica]THD04034.1 hypothetical protein B1810_07190 [Panacagrimonas perspica]